MFPAVIKQQKFDIANGIDITFVERPPDAYAAQFNSGEFQVGGSASVLIVGLGATRGIKTSYLFNLFDYFGTVVTGRPEIKTLADLAGKQVAAAKGTTNYTMFAWFAKQQGVDPDSLQVVNTATPGLVGYALADRADAVQLWEPAYTLVKAQRPDIRTIDLNIAKTWRAYAGGGVLPYLGVAAHQEWVDTHRDLIPGLYRAYKQAAAWVVADSLAPTARQEIKALKEKFALSPPVDDNGRPLPAELELPRMVHLAAQERGLMIYPGAGTDGVVYAVYILVVPRQLSLDSGLLAEETASDSRYNSLQASVTRRFSRGLRFLAAYTYSKSMDDMSGGSTSIFSEPGT